MPVAQNVLVLCKRLVHIFSFRIVFILLLRKLILLGNYVRTHDNRGKVIKKKNVNKHMHVSLNYTFVVSS